MTASNLFVVCLILISSCAHGRSLAAVEVIDAITALERANNDNGSSNCHIGATDFVFVLDESGSIGSSNFQIILQFLANLTLALDIGPGDDQSRVGLVVFNETAHIRFVLNTYMTNTAVYNAILGQNYDSGGNEIAVGMDAATNQVFTDAGGWRPSASNIMIVLTDGADDSDVSSAYRRAAAKNITTYAIGIGTNGNDYVQLLKIAGGDASHVFNVTSFNGLNNFLPTICNSLTTNSPRECKCTPQNIYLDIVIAVDSSDGMGTGFKFTIELLGDIIAHMTVNQTQGAQASRIAFLNFASTVEVVGNLSSYESAQDASTAVKNMRRMGGPNVDLTSVVRNASVIFESGGRGPNIKRVLLLLTSASALCPSDSSCRPADDLKLQGVTIVSVAMGFEDAPPIIQLGSDCNSLDNSGALAPKILNALCQANCYCPPHYTQFISSAVMCRKYAECVLAGPNGLETWDGAQGTCQEPQEGLKGYLVDSLSAEKEAFLKMLAIRNNAIPFWIGLNDKAQSGTYVWDRGTDPPLPSHTSDYNNFAASMPNEGGQGKKCIMTSPTTGFLTAWMNALCDDIFGAGGTKNVLCQTIAYDTDNLPGSL